MNRPSASRNRELNRLVVGIVLTFLGAVLIPLGSVLSEVGRPPFVFALMVTVIGLGLLLSAVARFASRESRCGPRL